VFQCPSGRALLNERVLLGARIHGISVHETKRDDCQVLLAVHGARQLAVAALCEDRPTPEVAAAPPTRSQQRHPKLRILCHLQNLPDWILQAEFMSVTFHNPSDAASAGHSAGTFSCDVALGLMNNYLELWEFEGAWDSGSCGPERPSVRATCVSRADCSERLLLYSMRLAKACETVRPETAHSEYDVVIASGAAPSSLLPRRTAVRSAQRDPSCRHDLPQHPRLDSTPACGCTVAAGAVNLSALQAAGPCRLHPAPDMGLRSPSATLFG
jgi:hypothetical protein